MLFLRRNSVISEYNNKIHTSRSNGCYHLKIQDDDVRKGFLKSFVAEFQIFLATLVASKLIYECITDTKLDDF
jgi:hypothetical protein